MSPEKFARVMGKAVEAEREELEKLEAERAKSGSTIDIVDSERDLVIQTQTRIVALMIEALEQAGYGAGLKLMEGRYGWKR